jgi:hypothetical protein
MLIEAMLRRIKSVLKSNIKVAINNKFESFGRFVKYRYRCIIADHGADAFLEHWNSSSLFPQGWKSLTSYTKVKYICEQQNKNIRTTLNDK